MAKRKSKYEMLVGTEVNGVLVSNYRKLKRTSKSGRTYYRYEVELNEVLWVSTTSFNKGSYGKRLAKAMNSVKTQNKARRGASKSSEAKLLPMVYNPYERDFIGRVSGNVLDTMENEFDECMTKHEVRKIFKKYATLFHPDSSKHVFDKIAWNILVRNRDIALTCVEIFEEGLVA